MLRGLRWCGAVVLLLSGRAAADDWPMFRGPQGTGVSAETEFPVEWGPEKNVRWTTELTGTGNSSPIVSAGRVFVTTATEKGRQRHLVCLDRTNGKVLWTRTVSYPHDDPTHTTNPHAGSTPAADGEVVVVWHGSAGVHCYGFDGEPRWSRDLGEYRHIWGYGSSPVLWRDRIFLNAGPGERQRMVALDRATGRVLWETPEPGGSSGEEKDPQRGWIGSWSTPVLITVDGAPQLLCSQPTRAVAYDPADGKILWWVTGLASPPRGDLVYTSPVIGDGLAVTAGGFQGPIIAFRLGGEGDVTETNRLWRQTQRNPQRIGSGVIVEGDLYQPNAGPTTIQCVDAHTGDQQWQARLPGGNAWGSVVQAGGRLYVTTQSGTTHVFRPNPESFDLLASNTLGESSNATPALSNGEIFLRTAHHLYCIAHPAAE